MMPSQRTVDARFRGCKIHLKQFIHAIVPVGCGTQADQKPCCHGAQRLDKNFGHDQMALIHNHGTDPDELLPQQESVGACTFVFFSWKLESLGVKKMPTDQHPSGRPDMYQTIRDRLNGAQTPEPQQRRGMAQRRRILRWKIVRLPLFLHDGTASIIVTTPFDRGSKPYSQILRIVRNDLRSKNIPDDILENLHATSEGMPESVAYLYYRSPDSRNGSELTAQQSRRSAQTSTRRSLH